MNIPRTEEEFIKDILDNCAQPSVFNALSQFLLNTERKNLNKNSPLWADRVRNRILKYGVLNPNIPTRWSDEELTKYLKRIWDKNQDAILTAKGLTIEHRNAFIGSSRITQPFVKNWLLEKEDSEEWNNGWFTRLPYHKRKFITPVKSFDDYREATPDIVRFRISHIPSDVKFEDCIPAVGELYIAHPYRPGVYLPVSKYEHLLFRERIHELSKVMMALGATEIKTLQNLDNKLNSSSEESSNTSASAGVGRGGKAKGLLATLSKSLTESQKSDSIVINFKSDPMVLPYLPEGLIWYPHDKDWQHIAESRLHGNILEYEINLSSKEINLVSELERSNIEAQAKVLFASASFSHSSSSQTFFKEESAKSTSILIKFKSRKNY